MKRCAKTPDLRVSRAKLLVRISLCSILALQMYSAILFSQQPTQEWVARYPGTGNCSMQGMCLDKYSNSYITGKLQNGDWDIITAKYNSSGVQQWIRTYDDTTLTMDESTGISVDSSGNAYIIGVSWLNLNPVYYLLLKYNTDGVLQWIKKFNYSTMGVPNGVSLDNFGNVYVASSTDTTGVIAKFDTAGDTLWVRRYSESGKETYFGKIQNNDSNIYILGFNYESFPLNSDILTLKYNSEGIFKWAVKYTGPRPYGLDQVRGIAIDESGNTYVTGIADNGSSSRYDMATIKYDWNGVQKWVKIYNGAANLDDAPSAIKTDHSGNVIITGYSQWSGALGGINYTTIKYNSIGDTLWTRFYNGPSNDEDIAYDLDVDTTNKVYVTGRSLTTGTIYDIATLKYDENGQQIWSKIYDGFGKNDIGLSVETDNSLNVYVSGTSKNILVDLLTIKYSQVVGLATIISEAPCDFQLLQNYPNPFNPVTNIRFVIPTKSFVQLRIYDVLGRLIEKIVDKQLFPSVYEVTFDGTKYASGSYFYQLIADNLIIDTKKFIVVK